jgi:hypothetical protein
MMAAATIAAAEDSGGGQQQQWQQMTAAEYGSRCQWHARSGCILRLGRSRAGGKQQQN